MNALDQLGKWTVSAGIVGSLGAGMGYIYGSMINSDKLLVAKAFCISAVALSTFFQFSAILSENNDDLFYSLLTMGIAVGGVVQIIAFRELNLISQAGTAVMVLGYGFSAAVLGIITIAKI